MGTDAEAGASWTGRGRQHAAALGCGPGFGQGCRPDQGCAALHADNIPWSLMAAEVCTGS